MMHLSVRAKILLLVSSIFLIVTTVSTVITARVNREQVLDGAKAHAHNLADGYFDVLNTMMITGVIANREIAREKLLKYPEVLEARAIRSDKLNAQFPPRDKKEEPRDALDQRALRGESVSDLNEVDGQRVLTVIQPAIATKKLLPGGLTCLNCHIVPEGTVLGAVRIDYSLAERDKSAHEALMRQVVINILLFLMGIVLLFWSFNRLMVRPIKRMLGIIERVREGDLTQQLSISNRDELGQISNGLDAIVGKLRQDIIEIQDSARGLSSSSSDLNQVSGTMAAQADDVSARVGEVASAADNIGETATRVAGEARSINNDVHLIAESSKQVTQSMARVDEVVKQAEENLAALSDSARQMTTTIDEIAENAEKTRAEASRAVVAMSEANSQMANLEQVTREIGKVVYAIEEIAELTQTLSLNATIEAARAGSAGRGFAVVAEQVRQLAKQTNDATDEIQQQVINIQASTKGAAGEIKRMDAVIQQVNQMVENIASAVEEQSATMRENADHISRTVGGMEEVAKQVSSTNGEMNHIANRIDGVVGKAESVTRHGDDNERDTSRISGSIHKVSEASIEGARGAEQVSQLAEKLVRTAARLDDLVARFRT